MITVHPSPFRREVFFLVNERGRVLWSDASSSPVRLPDSRARWTAIWLRRQHLVEIAHSHPIGPLAFSQEDETTMDALVGALGRSLVFSVVAPLGRRHVGMVRTTVVPGEPARRSPIVLVDNEPPWALLLRRASGMLA